MLALRALLLIGSLSYLMYFGSQDQCTYSADCRTGECLTYENGRFVCTPATYTVAVYDRDCIESIKLEAATRLEAPLSSEGVPDTAHVKLNNATITFQKICMALVQTRNK